MSTSALFLSCCFEPIPSSEDKMSSPETPVRLQQGFSRSFVGFSTIESLCSSYLILYLLTHLSRMKFPSLIYLFFWVVWWYLHFYSNFIRTFCKQTLVTLIRRCILRRLIWVCTFCLCPTKRTHYKAYMG